MDSYAKAGFIVSAILFYIFGFLVLIGPAHSHIGRAAWIPKPCCELGGDCEPVIDYWRAPDGTWFVRTKRGTMLFPKDYKPRPTLDPDGKDYACINLYDTVQKKPTVYRGRCWFRGGLS